MKHDNKKIIRKPGRHAVLMAVCVLLLACTAGCHSSDDASSSTIPKATPQSKAQSATEIQNNPNIPPQAKAHIISQMQGTAPPAYYIHGASLTSLLLWRKKSILPPQLGFRPRNFPLSTMFPNFISLPQLTTVFGLLAVAVLSICALPAAANPPAGYKLDWSDEFHGAVGSPPDPAHWGYDTGDNGWGNNEMEDYVADTQHAQIIADPAATDGRALQILATYNGQGLTHGNFQSARLLSRGKVTAQYGYIEARLHLPSGQGIWPAFWMLGADIDAPGVGWPRCGEIDIMENKGREPSVNHSSLHGPGYSGGSPLTATYALPSGQKFSDGYHTFGILWTADSITFSVDGQPFETRTPADLPPGKEWAFNHPFFFLLNVAVGGHFGGDPDTTTVFPQKLLVDYVRVYKPL